MNRTRMMTIGIATVWLAAVTSVAISGEDKYAAKVPGGLAMSEFKGYESWQTISVSRNERVLAVILGNPAMIAAYQAGIPGNGQSVPDGARMAKIHWTPKPNAFFKDATVPGDLLNVDFMVKTAGGSRTAAGGGMRSSITTQHRIRLRLVPQLARRRRETMPSAGSRVTRLRRREITCSRSTGSGEGCTRR